MMMTVAIKREFAQESLTIEASDEGLARVGFHIDGRQPFHAIIRPTTFFKTMASMSLSRRLFSPVWKASAVLALSLASLAGQQPSAVQVELERLEREKEAALRPVILASQQRLAKMLAEFTRTGRLDEAVTAKEALQQLQTGNGETSRLAGTEWTRKPENLPDVTGYLKLLASGLAKSKDGSWEARGLVTRWEHVGGRVVLLTIEQGRSDQLCEVWIFDPKWKSYKGYSFEGVRVEGAEVNGK
jgi:hypothetical protein